MAVGMDITLTFLTALVGAVEYSEVFIFQERSTFDGHRSTDIVVSGFNFLVRETEGFQQAPFEVLVLGGFETQALQALFPKGVDVEDKADLESGADGSIQLFDLIGDKSFFAE